MRTYAAALTPPPPSPRVRNAYALAETLLPPPCVRTLWMTPNHQLVKTVC